MEVRWTLERKDGAHEKANGSSWWGISEELKSAPWKKRSAFTASVSEYPVLDGAVPTEEA